MTKNVVARSRLASIARDFSPSTIVAGFVAILVGYTSSVAIVFQAATALGATPAQLASWMWALGLGMGLTSIIPTLMYRRPVLCAWCTPGAALIASSASSASGISMAEAIGAFMVCAVLITIAGATRWFERVMDRIPVAIASALLAGVLLRFALDAFKGLQTDFWLVFVMCATYLGLKRWLPRYAVPGVLLAGILAAFALGSMNAASLSAVQFTLTTPVWTTPQFTLASIVSIGIPLFVVTMASQNLPGVAAIRASGYDTPVSPAITITGIGTLLLAPFGAFALNLAAITAAICMNKEAHEDPARRYTAVLAAGFFYCCIGLFGAVVAGVLAAFPKALVVAVAGLALLGTIGGGLAAALKDENHREAALIAFLITASGVTLAGVGSAFWGVVGGGVAMLALRR